MDAVSYSLGAKQAVRIKKFVAEPDATSGLVTLPSTIAVGETITIPAGRTVVHPNLQVDGVLNVEGSLFVPAGGSVSETTVNTDVLVVDTSAILPSNTAIGSISSTELGYIDGVTSNIQVQLDTKQRMQLMTAQDCTSGTFKDFNGIPSWAKKITVMFNGVSTIGTSHKLIQLGSGSVQTTGYSACGGYLIATVGATNSDVGFLIWTVAPSGSSFGQLTFSHMGSNLWVCSGSLYANDAQYLLFTSGAIPLSGVLDRLRITTVNGTDTFDAGQINVMYEG